MLVKNQQNHENSWKQNKIVKMHAWRKVASKDLLKYGFYVYKFLMMEFLKKIGIIWWKKVFWNPNFKAVRSHGKENWLGER